MSAGIISKYSKDGGLIKGLMKPTASTPAGCGGTAGRSPGEEDLPCAAVVGGFAPGMNPEKGQTTRG